MKNKWTITGSIVAVVLLALAVGLTQAQGPQPPEGSVQPQGDVGIEAAVEGRIPIQGRLTDASGNPLNGSYSITASIYNVSSGGTALCSKTQNVNISGGLFNMTIDNCTSNHVNGQQLYLGIKVGPDAEMTPRQPIYPVPYAWSLRPGAIISATSGHGLEVRSAAGGGYPGTALWVENSSTGDGIALWAKANGTDATVISSNNGSGPLFKGFGNDGGEHEFIVLNNGDIWTEGHVSQSATSNGLVKAAVYADCSSTGSSVYRSFNNVTGGAVTITSGEAAGRCTLDFGFDISGRYWVASAVGTECRVVTCVPNGNNKLDCYRFDCAGNGYNGPIMVTLY